MIESSPEPAMRRVCDAILVGDFYGAMADLTPEAANEAMMLGAGLAGAALPESYVIESHEEMDGAHRFGVRFVTSARDFRASATWKAIDGFWKITAIGVEDL